MSTRTITITTPTGLHARPAALFVKEAVAQPATVTIAKAGGAAVPAASILGILGLQIEFGDEITLASDDADADASLDALAAFLSVNLDA
ncbi:MAG TPA: HPr family phosphocarrier protein [Glaciihabitans sp.]|jgi:phosphocarrier protein|nr:HPr family phosphocarrier protein [Glaciihabitans sp.]